MRTVTDWLGEYAASHQHPTNKLLHWICVPPIVLAVMGLLWSAPVPAEFSALSPWLNWATLAAAAAIVYYLVLSPALEARATRFTDAMLMAAANAIAALARGDELVPDGLDRELHAKVTAAVRAAAAAGD